MLSAAPQRVATRGFTATISRDDPRDFHLPRDALNGAVGRDGTERCRAARFDCGHNDHPFQLCLDRGRFYPVTDK